MGGGVDHRDHGGEVFAIPQAQAHRRIALHHRAISRIARVVVVEDPYAQYPRGGTRDVRAPGRGRRRASATPTAAAIATAPPAAIGSEDGHE